MWFFLTIAFKVGQILIGQFEGQEVNEEARELVQDLHIGGVIYYSWLNGLTSPEQVRDLSSGLQSLASTPLLIAVDQEGGRVARLKKRFTQFPGNGFITNEEQARETGRTLGKELTAVGVNLNLAPVVDTLFDPASPIGSRSFGSDPLKVTQFASAMIGGFHEFGLLSTLKHFPGLGAVKVDSHLDLPVLEEVGDGMIPFLSLKNETDLIMTAHILIPSLDPDHCATLSEKILKLLDPFEGVILSDSLDMEGVVKQAGSIPEAAILALNAGCDLLLVGGTGFNIGIIRQVHAALVDAVQTGRISEERLDVAYNKVQKLKGKIGRNICY